MPLGERGEKKEIQARVHLGIGNFFTGHVAGQGGDKQHNGR